jgi:hypothetical protein
MDVFLQSAGFFRTGETTFSILEVTGEGGNLDAPSSFHTSIFFHSLSLSLLLEPLYHSVQGRHFSQTASVSTDLLFFGLIPS